MKIKNWHFCIVIPARNEEKLISRCLISLKKAAMQLPDFCTYDVILAVDASCDQTFEISKNLIGEHGTVINIDVESVGAARKHATDLALQRYKGDLSLCWLANTDADCEIPLQWLQIHLEHAFSGTQALAGVVSIDSFEEHNSHVAKRFQETYIMHPDGTHPHIHGANLGVRADAYIRAGGWNCIQTAEDHDLWNRLKPLSIPMRSDSQCTVITSGRRMGRAPFGFAQALSAHN